MAGEILLEKEGPVATVTIDNQSKRNALSPPLIAEAIDIFDRLGEDNNIRCVVLTGTGEKAFSAGFDITYHSDDAPELEEEEEGDFRELCDKVRYFDYPVIAMINGGTFGGSMHLIAACDLRVAVEDAQFGITPARLGLVYRGKAINEIMSHIGPGNVKEFLFTAEFIDADRAYDMGLLNDVVPREQLKERTYELADTIAGNAPISLISMKEIIRALLDHGWLTDAEQEWVSILREESEDSRDHTEGVRAFQENREPEFEGY